MPLAPRLPLHSAFLPDGVRRTVLLLAGGAVLLAGAALPVPRLAAQAPGGAILGIVVDSAGAAVGDVHLTLLGPALATRSDSAGSFQLQGVEPGTHVLRVRRLGYRERHLELRVRSGEVHRVTVVLAVAPVRLEGIDVAGTQPSRMDDFERRRRSAMGAFITRAEIERARPQRLSDMVRTLAGVRLVGHTFADRVLLLGRSASCRPAYFVDGRFIQGWGIDIIPPMDIEGVEIYRGHATVPAQFSRRESACGVVVIWTREPG